MSGIVETLKSERSRLLGEAQKVERAILLLDPKAFITTPPVNGNGHTNGNGHAKSDTKNGEPKKYRKKSKERLMFLRRSRAARKAWAAKSPEERAAWAAALRGNALLAHRDTQ